ncbi:MAG: TolC family protein [Planctomycetaceae bacterium]
MFIRKQLREFVALGVTCLMIVGCRTAPLDVTYHGEPAENDYRGYATTVSFPTVDTVPAPEVLYTMEPHTVRDESHFDLRPVSLNEAVETALKNAQIIRSGGQFLSPGNSLLVNPNNVSSVYDPAIQESGVLFGGRGVEAALAAFDTTFSTSMVWGRNETVQNNFFGDEVLSQETAQMQATLSKTFAYGGTLQFQHNVNYGGTSNTSVIYPSTYTGNLVASYRQPLLAGAGTEFTRIAGPISQNFGGISGVSQGVVIARINNDITIAQFEGSLNNLVKDVEDAYWDLYLAYRNFNTAATARDAVEGTWDVANKRAGRDLLPADEAQARDGLYSARAAVMNTRSQIFTQETRLRRLMGLPVNDGTILQPSDEPVSAEIVPDWSSSLGDALMKRYELRQQKWNIKSFQLQLTAAESLTQPQLDLLASWQTNGFGDNLVNNGSAAPFTNPRLKSYYDTLLKGQEQGWGIGVQMNVPIGFRSAKAQVQNYELRLAKAYRVLAEQEKEIAQELAVAFQEVARTYSAALENYNRYQAASQNVDLLMRDGGQTLTIDFVLRAQQRLADAEVQYFSSLIEYNKSLANLQYRKGMLLEHNNVRIMEGGWSGESYQDAARVSEGRSYAMEPVFDKYAEPAPFASSVPFSTPYIEPGSYLFQGDANAPFNPEGAPIIQDDDSAQPTVEEQELPYNPPPASERTTVPGPPTTTQAATQDRGVEQVGFWKRFGR